MCLAIPAKVIELVQNNEAKVDYGGVTRTVNLELVEVKVGDYVLIHAGFAIEVMDKSTAMKSLKELDSLVKVEN